MARFANRWIFFVRNSTRAKSESGRSLLSECRQVISSIASKFSRKMRQLSPRNLLLTILLKDGAHF